MRLERSMTKRKRRAFCAELRAEAVRPCNVGDGTIGQVAKDLGLTETALRQWVKRAELDAGKGLPEALTTAECEELQRRAGRCGEHEPRGRPQRQCRRGELLRDAQDRALQPLHSFLGYRSLIEFELKAQCAAVAA